MNEAKPSASPRRKLSESGYLKIDIPKCQFNFVKRQHERSRAEREAGFKEQQLPPHSQAGGTWSQHGSVG
ncbi:hypothetical protein QYF36_025267 [Acer negundo]|nr:hypothetical protein QYF36_025267 [Acer negundo]